MASSGDVPPPARPSSTLQWTPQGLVLARNIQLIMPRSESGLRQCLQPRCGREEGEFPQPDISTDIHTDSETAPVHACLMVLLDTSEYDTAGNKTQSARLLGISRRNLIYKLRSYGM